MDNKDLESFEKKLKEQFLKPKNSSEKKGRRFIQNSIIVINKEVVKKIKAGTLGVKKGIKMVITTLKPPDPGNTGMGNGGGAHMPAFLLAPHRILGPAFLGLGVLTIIILSMFAG